MTDTALAEREITSTRGLRVALIGNVNPDIFWSTENEYLDAYVRAGVSVSGFQEGPDGFKDLTYALEHDVHFDFVHWTRTKSLADAAGDAAQWQMLAAARRRNIPVIGVHLDRWEGLKAPDRESQVGTDVYFRGVDILFTADGDAQELWDAHDVNHRWLLPAISERWLGLGTPKPEYECDIVFVGGWFQYGHKAWTHRSEMIERLTAWYGDRFLALPRHGQPRIVGRDLNDVYASAKVVVGDSCLIPHSSRRPKRNYCSDRIPETLGRGGILIHPSVEGIDETMGRHFTWRLGDWGLLRELIETVISDDGKTQWFEGSPAAHRQGNVDHIAAHHTYTHRVHEIIDTLTLEGLL